MANRKGFRMTWIALIVMASGAGSIYAQGGPPQGGQGFRPNGQQGGPPQGGMRMGPPHGPMLLLNPQVIKELKETDDQVKQIQALLQRNRPPQGGGQGFGGPPPQGGGQRGGGEFDGPPPMEEGQQGGRPPQGGPGRGGPGFGGGFGGGQQGGPGGPGGNPEDGKRMEAAIKKILSDSQYKRYRQIDIQVDGPRAFQRPEVSEALGLTEEQHESIREIMESNRPPQGGPGQGGPPQGGPGGQGGDPGKFADELMKKLMGVLTDSQKNKWKEMTGAPFKLQRPQGQPGRQGGPGGPPPGGGFGGGN